MANNLKLALLITAEADQARREMAATGKAARDLGAEAAEVGSRWSNAAAALDGSSTAAGGLRDAVAGLNGQMSSQMGAMADAAQGAAAYRAELDDIRDSFNPLFAASRDYHTVLDAIASAEAVGAINAREAALAHDHVARALMGVQASAEAAGVPVRGLGPAGQSAATGMQQLIDRLNGVQGANEGAAAAALRHGQQLDALRAKYNPLFAASRQYELELREIAEAERLGAISAMEAANARERAAASMAPMTASMMGFGQATRASSMHTANLAAQLNDIGVMAAYQNPIQLALQQGTQINQVFSQMGGGIGAVRSLGGAIRQIINPLSLLTIGIIAFGAAGFQWLMSLREEAKSLEDVFEDLSSAIDDLRSTTNRMSVAGLSELERTYGRVTVEVERLIAAQDRLARRQADAEMQALRRSVEDIAGPKWFDLGISDRASGVLALQRELKITRAEAEGLFGALQQVGETSDLDVLANSFAGIAFEFELMERRTGALTDAQTAFLANIVEAEDKVRQLMAIDTMKGVWDERAGENLLANLRDQVSLQDAIARHGEDSRQVTALRIDAERRAHEEMLATLDISDGLRAQLIAAWDAANGLAATDMRAGIAAARDQARDLADEIFRAVDAAQSLSRSGEIALEDAKIRAEYSDPADQAYHLAAARMRRSQGILRDSAGPAALAVLDAEVQAYADNAAAVARLDEETRRLNRTRRDGASAKQADAVRDLISSLQTELDILRESDPVMQEMLRHRDVLAEATADERREIEAKIRALLEEADIQERVKAQMEEVRDLGREMVQGLARDLRDGVSAGDMLANMLDRIADKLMDMAASGISDVLFGAKGSSDPGLLGTALGSLLGGIKFNALGDVIGSPTLFAYGDRPGQLGVMGEAGAEAIMPLTHAMGGGVGALMAGRETTLPLTRLSSGKLGVQVPAPFALGGTFGHLPAPPSAVLPSSRAGAFSDTNPAGDLRVALDLRLSDDLNARIDERASNAAVNVTRQGLEQFSRHALPNRMRQIQSDGRRQG